MSIAKSVESVLPGAPKHWVGDGFPVRSVFSPQVVGDRLSPYVLFDYAGPERFEPADRARGVDSHPHRGFETVTVVFQGELEHRDTAGNSGSIGPGDVQWMTAASGVLHEERHSQAFTRDGGVLEMAQLWVNLPAKHKMDPPRYQTLESDSIPVITLPEDAGSARIIAGDFDKTPGAASTVTPVILWEVNLRANREVRLPIAEGWAGAVFVRRGTVLIDGESVERHQCAMLTREGEGVTVRAEEDAALLVVGGEPIDEPVVAHGPFVMNTQDEIRQAIEDLRAGRFGSL